MSLRHAPELPAMCGPCGDEWVRWLDTIPRPAFRIWPGVKCGTYEGSASGVEWLRAAKAEDAYATIRWQQAHIEQLCAAGSHVQDAARETSG